ncbi:hypothetical protein C5167_037020 [Papaver somniferum]|uniref:Glycosyltransferase 2-like domain-containing protein n=1 Tax=Papaver somniferum TaxID=3469 RepID=A0A4Y7I8B5_PAPSO|nr:cellulose synthase-like protein G3 [Papaver somniferum]RZC44070.1 hypothetical protein C5167_037020 [Papaver somniferum]
MKNGEKTSAFPLNSYEVHPRTIPSRAFMLIYVCGIIALLYHHLTSLRIHSVDLLPSILLLIADLVLSFMWVACQAFRWSPVRRKVYPENLSKVVDEDDLPTLDVFICTADPYKEPPMEVVNTALSVLAFDYPSNKISVYVSDDGGSQMTLFALIQGSKFAIEWLPFCKKHNLSKRCPKVVFNQHDSDADQLRSCIPQEEFLNMKILYEEMRTKVEHVMGQGCVDDDMLVNEEERQVFSKWIYSSRSFYNHSDTASAIMTSAPIVLCIDCDMYCNNPQAPRLALCHLLDPVEGSKIAFAQFPPRFRGINPSDIYDSEFTRPYIINPEGLDGIGAVNCVGSGPFVNRKAFYGAPTQSKVNIFPGFNGDHEGALDRRITMSSSKLILEAASRVADCNYEQGTNWGLTVSDPWFYLYAYLFLATYIQDFIEGYYVYGINLKSWWNEQRMWLMRAASSCVFSFIELILYQIGIMPDFSLTSKVIDDEQQKRYNREIFDFGVDSPIFMSLSTFPLVNLVSFSFGIMKIIFIDGKLEEMLVRLFLSGFLLVNSWPIYEAMVRRKDGGRMPAKVTLLSALITLVLCYASGFVTK